MPDGKTVSENRKFAGAYLLDSSALLTYACDEAGADTIQALLRSAHAGHCTVLLSFITLMEACSEVWLREGEEAARLLYGRISDLPIQQVGMDADLLWSASEVKTTRPLSVTESWLFATAKRYQAVLVHKDPHLEHLQGIVSSISL